jgi:hypothetical protein
MTKKNKKTKTKKRKNICGKSFPDQSRNPPATNKKKQTNQTRQIQNQSKTMRKKLSVENPPLTNPETHPRQPLTPALDWSWEGFPRIVLFLLFFWSFCFFFWFLIGFGFAWFGLFVFLGFFIFLVLKLQIGIDFGFGGLSV